MSYTVVYSYQDWQIMGLERTVFVGIERVIQQTQNEKKVLCAN